MNNEELIRRSALLDAVYSILTTYNVIDEIKVRLATNMIYNLKEEGNGGNE